MQELAATGTGAPRAFSKTAGEAERAWFAPPFGRFGALCPSYGIGLALGALSQHDAEAVVSSCAIVLAHWAPGVGETSEARVWPVADGWRFDAGGLQGHFGTAGSRLPTAIRGEGSPLSFGNTDRIMACGLCGVATSAALSRTAARARGYADMILPLHVLARAALQHAATLRMPAPARLQISTAGVTVDEPLSLQSEVFGGALVVHLCAGSEPRALIELGSG